MTEHNAELIAELLAAAAGVIVFVPLIGLLWLLFLDEYRSYKSKT